MCVNILNFKKTTYKQTLEDLRTGDNDESLLLLIKEHNHEAFTEIYRKYWQSLYSSAYKRLQNEELGKDIVQNVFMDLWTRKDQVEIKNLAAYLHTAVRFQVYKQSVKNLRSSELVIELEEVLTSPFRTDGTLIENEMMRLVDLWINALPEKRRNIFLMHYYEELSTGEISKMLGISQKTVQNQLITASTYVRERFAQALFIYLLVTYFS